MAHTVSIAAQNEQALNYFVTLPISQEMIQHLAEKASQVVRRDPTQQLAQASTGSGLPPIRQFIASLALRSGVQISTLMTSLVYLDRLRIRLPPAAKGKCCAIHRIFLASLVLATKYLNDSSPKNRLWARYSSVHGYDHFGFSLAAVNSMERQLLSLLDWNLRICPEELYRHLEPFLAPVRKRFHWIENFPLHRRTKRRIGASQRNHGVDTVDRRSVPLLPHDGRTHLSYPPPCPPRFAQRTTGWSPAHHQATTHVFSAKKCTSRGVILASIPTKMHVRPVMTRSGTTQLSAKLYSSSCWDNPERDETRSESAD